MMLFFKTKGRVQILIDKQSSKHKSHHYMYLEFVSELIKLQLLISHHRRIYIFGK